MELDAATQRLAAERYGVVTGDELTQLGMSAQQRARRLRSGLLVRLHHNVYVVPGVPSSFEQRAVAASLAAGDHAAVSHRSAARLWGLRGATSPRVEVTVNTAGRPRLTGVVVHRSRLLERLDVRIHDGVPVTRPERTLIDAAAVLDRDRVTSMFESAVHLGLTTPDQLWRYLSRYGGHGRPGAGPIQGILNDRGPAARPTESGLEDLALRVLYRCGAPPPERQYVIEVAGRPGIRVDFAYTPARLALEVDSARWHSDSESYRRDRAKWNLLAALGWTLLILTDFDLHERPDVVGVDVVATLARLSQAAA